MGEPSRCALTSTPSMAPSSGDATRPVKAGADAGRVSAKLALAETRTRSTMPFKMSRRPSRICMERTSHHRLFGHQAIDFDRGRSVATGRRPPDRASQLEAFLGAGDLDVLRVDVLVEAGEFEMALGVRARHEARIAVLDLRADLGIGDDAAAIDILGEAEERYPGLRIVFFVLVERGA